jgi:S-adenosylmethionine hydrolase
MHDQNSCRQGDIDSKNVAAPTLFHPLWIFNEISHMRFVLPFYNDANTILFVGSASVVACITDFGTSDYYAGALRGALADLIPGMPIVDITHEIPAADIRRAAMVLWEAQPSFPEGSVFLVVVDPGVGSARRPAAFRFPRCDVVCPDNGAATFLMERFPKFEAVEINPLRVTDRPISNTFHGRDIFAPAAARLFLGKDPRELGTAIVSPVRIPLPLLAGSENGGWEGEVLYSDHFGNAVTSIGQISFDFQTLQPWLHTGAQGGRISKTARILLEDGRNIPIGRTYADAKNTPDTIALAGSNGLLEIASYNSPAGGSAALQPGTRVRLASSV